MSGFLFQNFSQKAQRSQKQQQPPEMFCKKKSTIFTEHLQVTVSLKFEFTNPK